MSSFSRLRVGLAGTPQDTTLRQSLDNNIVGTYLYPPQVGVPLSVAAFYSVVPAVIVANSIALSQTPAGAGALTLTAGTGVTSTTLNGVSVLKLDCHRCVTITGVGGTVQRNYTIKGYDYYGQALTCTFAGPNGAQAIVSPKAFMFITSITVDGGTTSAITVGQSDTLGLIYRTDAFEYASILYNGAAITANTGFTVADATSPATAATGDVRGTYALQSASDGIKRFAVDTQLLSIDTVNGVWGVPQFSS